MYLDLTPVKSFLHGPAGAQTRVCSPTPPCPDPPAEPLPADPGPAADEPLIGSTETPELQVQAAPPLVSRPHLSRPLSRLSRVCFLQKQVPQESPEPEEAPQRITTVKIQTEQQKISFPPSCPDALAASPVGAGTPVKDTPAGAGTPVKDKLRVTPAGTCAG